jgi:hypothetical protein
MGRFKQRKTFLSVSMSASLATRMALPSGSTISTGQDGEVFEAISRRLDPLVSGQVAIAPEMALFLQWFMLYALLFVSHFPPPMPID